MYLISTIQAQQYMQQWEQGSLPKSDWTHEMHLIAGVYILCNYPETPLAAMRQRIKVFNEAVGTANSDTSGYHETITVFWLWQLAEFLHQTERHTFDEVTLDLLLFEEKLAQRNTIFDYYSESLVKSVAARRHMMMPDLKPMPQLQKLVPDAWPTNL